MKIKIITCHDVYNYGASLQAYALQHYLEKTGNDVEVIDYKPDYLSHHYDYKFVANSKFDRPFVRAAYIAAKFPSRFREHHEGKKGNFDLFKQNYLHLTKKYGSNEELKEDPPEADVFFAGSDQIWNSILPNGNDGSFYLDFVPKLMRAVKASYSASFGGDRIPENAKNKIKQWIEQLDFISVRERSGVELIKNLGVEKRVAQVLDPVFLLDSAEWNQIIKGISGISANSNKIAVDEKYILVYDFEKNQNIKDVAKILSRKLKCKVYTLQHLGYGDKFVGMAGPLEFLRLIHDAEYVLSNSFHATAFSVIFKKKFWVFERKEDLNKRLEDFLNDIGLSNHICNASIQNTNISTDWQSVDQILQTAVNSSKQYISIVISGAK